MLDEDVCLRMMAGFIDCALWWWWFIGWAAELMAVGGMGTVTSMYSSLFEGCSLMFLVSSFTVWIKLTKWVSQSTRLTNRLNRKKLSISHSILLVSSFENTPLDAVDHALLSYVSSHVYLEAIMSAVYTNRCEAPGEPQQFGLNSFIRLR